MGTKYKTDKKTLVYCRESRDDYGEKYERIETQRDILLEFCAKNGLTNIVDVIMDDNMSGTSFKRLEYIKEKMKNGEIEIFICKDASRLGRNLLESLKFIEFAEECEVEIIFESEEFNRDLFPLIAWFNERRAKDDSDKIRRVLRHKLENGLVIVPKFGYKKEDGKVIPDEEVADIVRKIGEMAYNGSTPRQISDYLNIIHALSPSEGNSIKRKKIHSLWTADKVRRIITDITYTGVQVSGKIRKVSYKGKKYKKVPPEEQIVIENHHEALIPKEMFDSIQKNLRTFKIPSRNPTNNPFSGILECGRCGKTIVLRSRKNGNPVKYVCSKHNLEGNIKTELREDWGCSPHAVYFEDLKNLIMNYVKAFMEDAVFQQEVIESINEESSSTNYESTIKNLEKREKDLQHRFDIMYEDRLNGILPEFMFTEKTEPILKKIQDVHIEIDNLRNEIKSSTKESPQDKYTQAIQRLYKEGLSAEGIKQLFEKIIIFEQGEIDEEIKNQYNVDDEQFEELYKNGGYLFVQKSPWNNLIKSKQITSIEKGA